MEEYDVFIDMFELKIVPVVIGNSFYYSNGIETIRIS